MEKYRRVSNQYYNVLVRVNYGAGYFKDTPSPDEKNISAYVNLLNNLGNLHSNLAKEKKERNLDFNDFREVLNIPDAFGKFVISKGKVMGDISACRDWSESKLNTLNPLNENYLYELALYASLCVSKEKEQFIEIPEELVSKIQKPEMEIVFEASAEKADKKGSRVSIFDMFALN